MAITQNLARVSVDLLGACRESAQTLDDVCSFNRLADECYLDVDWAPAMLLAAADADALETPARELLSQAFNGGVEVNPSYRDFGDSIWEHPVTELQPHGVQTVTVALEKLVESPFPTSSAIHQALASWPQGFTPDEPRPYLRHHLKAVATFFRQAVSHGEAVLAWWD